MLQRATITSLPKALRIIKEMKLLHNAAWDGDYRGAARDALRHILRERMVLGIDRHLDALARRGEADRRMLLGGARADALSQRR